MKKFGVTRIQHDCFVVIFVCRLEVLLVQVDISSVEVVFWVLIVFLYSIIEILDRIVKLTEMVLCKPTIVVIKWQIVLANVKVIYKLSFKTYCFCVRKNCFFPILILKIAQTEVVMSRGFIRLVFSCFSQVIYTLNKTTFMSQGDSPVEKNFIVPSLILNIVRLRIIPSTLEVSQSLWKPLQTSISQTSVQVKTSVFWMLCNSNIKVIKRFLILSE